VQTPKDSQQATPRQARRLIVDSQVHLWKAESPDWPWLPGFPPQLPEPMTIERLLPMMDEAGVDRVVVVPPSWPGDRNDYGIEAVKRYPDRFRVMGRIPLQNPDAAKLLPHWKEQPGLVGIRVLFVGPRAPWLTDGSAEWFWPAAAKAQLPVMFYAPGQVSRFAAIAERHPDLTLIMDHMCLHPSMLKDGTLGEAVAKAAALAKYPNMSVKLSGTPHVSTQSYPFRDMAAHLKQVFEAYGPRRCYWGTDLTNSFDRASYRQRVTHFTEQLDFLSEDDKDWVMGRAILERLNWT
jgi:predicted TIM-barrel fold metal-dependent hydrolase